MYIEVILNETIISLDIRVVEAQVIQYVFLNIETGLRNLIDIFIWKTNLQRKGLDTCVAGQVVVNH